MKYNNCLQNNEFPSYKFHKVNRSEKKLNNNKVQLLYFIKCKV